MKKLLLSLLLIGVLKGYAQIQYGVSVGFNTMSLHSSEAKFEKSPSGLMAGLTFKYIFTDNVNALIDIDFFQNKLTFDSDFLEAIEMSDIEEPEEYKYGGMRYRILGNYNFTENVGIIFGGYGDMVSSSDDTWYKKSFQYGLSAGVVGAYNNFLVELSYSLNLNNSFDLPDYDINGKYGFTSIRLSYLFVGGYSNY